LGSIDPGKDATLILVEGDPLELNSEVRRAWLAGHELDLSNRHQLLYEKYNARPKPVNTRAAAAPAAPKAGEASGGTVIRASERADSGSP
jgi:hypothetical protein